MAPLILALSLLFLIGLTLMFGGLLWWSYQDAVDEAGDTASELSRLVENQTARMLQASELMLAHLVDLATTIDWGRPEQILGANATLKVLVQRLPFVDTLWIFDGHGGLLASNMSDVPADLTVADRPYFQVHHDPAQGVYISAAGLGRVTGSPFFVISRRVSGADGSLRGVAAIAFNSNQIAQFFQNLEVGLESTFQLFKDDGRLLVRSPLSIPQDLLSATANATVMARMKTTPVGIYDYSARDGQERVGAYRKVAGYPIYVNIGIGKKAVITQWLSRTWRNSLFGALALAGIAILLNVVLRRARNEDRLSRELRLLNADLERRVEERTQTLETANEDLARLLKEKEILMREIHHRVKNNLQVVIGLLSLQASHARDDLKVYFAESRRRLHAMSKLHEQLYLRDNTAALDVAPYLEQLVADSLRSYGATLRVALDLQADSLLLPIDQATPLGLIVSEVVSNTLKHAFPDGTGGRLVVRLERGSAQARLEIIDDGVGLATLAPSDSSSTGLKLVRMLVEQLGASACFEPAGGEPPRGTRFVLELPIEQGNDEERG